jgi:hypothetical protein
MIVTRNGSEGLIGKYDRDPTANEAQIGFQ